MTLDQDGSLGFSFQAGHTPDDIDATLEHLLELPARLGADRDRRVALVFDEFQEIVNIDAKLLPLMRSVFQEQPDVAHVYLGSKRHMMEQIFNDANEPFWRSANRWSWG
jgi:AAA+ ATPase superfamily predicted ATPase